MSIRAQILAREVKRLVDLLLVTTNEDDIITIHGAIRLKLNTIRGILNGESK